MNKHNPFLMTLLGALLSGSLIAAISYTMAAPTQAPPAGNPAFPPGPTGPQGPAGTNGSNGTNGAKGDKGDTGPAGTWAPNRCEVCIEICDWNGAGPCVKSCATEGGGLMGAKLMPAGDDVDSNDQVRMSFDCW